MVGNVLDMCRGGRVNILEEGCSNRGTGRRQRGRPKRRFMDVVREDMKIAGVREEGDDRERWKTMSLSGGS